MDRVKSDATRRIGLNEVLLVDRLRVSVVEGEGKGRTFEVDADRPVSVGSAPDNHVVLADQTVSRYHVELTRAIGGLRIRDLGSLNGTQLGSLGVNDVIAPLGSTVRLGNTMLRLEDAESREAPQDDDVVEIPSIVGDSPAIRQVRRTVYKLAGASSSVLIQGETGTGKELVARAIHDLSDRAGHPFVVVDCGSMPATLIASELFGHERGAFTGADRRHQGAFERAGTGTIFLDELGELPLQVQSMLLGVLERREFRRIGGERELDVKARVIAATNRDLRAEVNKGAFRADLYFRLAITKVLLPPLRERTQDIDALVSHFAEHLSGQPHTALFSAEALALLRTQSWSGNIRELRNVVEAALTMGQLKLEGGAEGNLEPGAEQLQSYRDARALALTRFEQVYLRDLMARFDNNASEAARQARMDRPYLLSLLRRHGLR